MHTQPLSLAVPVARVVAVPLPRQGTQVREELTQKVPTGHGVHTSVDLHAQQVAGPAFGGKGERGSCLALR